MRPIKPQFFACWTDVDVPLGFIPQAGGREKLGALLQISQGIGTDMLVFQPDDVVLGAIFGVSGHLPRPQFPAKARAEDQIEHGPILHHLRKKGEYGILALMPRRAEFLSDPTHQIVFHYTPNHSFWMNQIEIWLSILVCKLLTCGSFTSVEDLESKVLAFIDYYNRIMAQPFKWTYQGKALRV